MVTGPGGSDTETKTGYVTVAPSEQNITPHGGKGLPFWVWIAIGVDAVAVLIATAQVVRRTTRRRA
jgi:PKD repeat protein